MDLLYRPIPHEPETLVFAQRDSAEEISRAWTGINTAKTWGDFKNALLPDEWAEREEIILEYIEDEAEDGGDISIDLEAPFDADKLPGYQDGYYPRSLQQAMVDWFPGDLADEVGTRSGAPGMGDFLIIPVENEERAVAQLRELGHTVEKSDLYFF